MGWFWKSGATSDEPSISREDRTKCWETRDAYFACLDRVGVIKSGEEGNACSVEHKKYERNCAKSWVRSINRSFVYDVVNMSVVD